MSEKYEKIAKKMGVIWNEEMRKILEALYNSEEADVLLTFNGPFLDRFTAEKIARKVKRPVEEMKPILDEMARTQRLFSAGKGEKRTYSMFPLVPGLFELYFSNHERAAAEEKETLMIFTKAYEKYYDDGNVVKAFSSKFPFMRVFVDQKAVEETIDRGKGKLIELDQDMEVVKNDILPFEQAKFLVEKSRKVAVMDCACRTHMKIHNNGVPVNDYPFNVCITFNTWAEYTIEQGFGRELTKEEALETLSGAAKAGLVHTTQNVQDKSTFMCNCDRDACIMLRGLTQFKDPGILANSNFIPEYEEDNCIFCKKCVNICPMYVISEVEGEEKITIDYDRCIGCGVCAFNCPEEALTMVKKYDKIPAANAMEAMAKSVSGRSH
jgi:Pyruvate/2-oxoacid:ferredoxin oxidoreductase delta subunit